MVFTNLTSDASKKKKTTQGRRKIEIKKIQEAHSRQVTFSKRRTGLFKKASELCVLTGAQIAILVNSPGGKVYSFGHPNADVLIDRYLNSMDQEHPTNVETGPTQSNVTPMLQTNDFNRHFVNVSKELELEKRKSEIGSTSSGGRPWYDEDNIDGMNVTELEEYLYSLIELKKKVVTRAHELMIINKPSALLGTSSGLNNEIQMINEHSALLGSNSRWNYDVNAAINGGFDYRHCGEVGRFN